MTIINASLHSNAKGFTLPKQTLTYSSLLQQVQQSHNTAKLRANKNLWNMSFNGFFTLYLTILQKTDTFTLNKPKASVADLPKQVRPFQITVKQRAKIIVHLEKGTCRKLMSFHQDPDLFLRNHSTVKNMFIYFKKECFRNMKVHFPCLTILILLFFEKVFEIQFSFLHY